MVLNILNSVMLVGFLISAVYGILIIARNNKIEKIFKAAFVSVIAFFVSRLFFIVLSLSDGDVNDFSVGVLGQVSAYLFLVLANRTYLPIENKKVGFDFRAALILIFPLACYGYSFIDVQTLGDAICSVLYMCSTCLAMYFSFENILQAKVSPEYKRLLPFFICVITVTITSSLESVVFVIDSTAAFTVVCSVLTAIVFADSVLILPLLNRGLKKDAR